MWDDPASTGCVFSGVTMLPGWYLTQLSTMIYVPFFACMAGTGITQQAVFLGVAAGVSLRLSSRDWHTKHTVDIAP